MTRWHFGAGLSQPMFDEWIVPPGRLLDVADDSLCRWYWYTGHM